MRQNCTARAGRLAVALCFCAAVGQAANVAVSYRLVHAAERERSIQGILLVTVLNTTQYELRNLTLTLDQSIASGLTHPVTVGNLAPSQTARTVVRFSLSGGLPDFEEGLEWRATYTDAGDQLHEASVTCEQAE